MNKLFVFLVLSAAAIAGARAQTPLSGSLQNDLLSSSSAMREEHAAMFDDAAGTAQRKSGGLAALYSLVLPGAGEMYVDGFDAGKYPLIAEGALWLTYGSMQYYGSWLREDARNFARSHAGLASVEMDDQFFVDIGNFSDTYQYNDKKLRDRNVDKLYSGAAYQWRWDSDANRQSFRDQRVSSERVFNNSRFVIGGMIVNRIISAINAVRLARRHNRDLGSGTGAWRLESSMPPTMDGVEVSLVRTF
ncbi:MAG: hypothetical protein ACM3Q4_02915 [Acidobacteriota bacterium]